MKTLFAIAIATTCLAGCGAQNRYSAQIVARGELTPRYDDGVELWAGGQRVAAAWDYDGLPEYVACVPKATEHANAAHSAGNTATALSILGGVLGMASLGGLGGIALLDKNPGAADAVIGSAIAVGVTGIVLAAIGRSYKQDANGHAVDAMNYYNDAVGSEGGTCADSSAQSQKQSPPR